MAAELTKVYRTADGKLFERDQRDAARSHDAYLDLVAFTTSLGESASAPHGLAVAIAHRGSELLAILRRNPMAYHPTQAE